MSVHICKGTFESCKLKQLNIAQNCWDTK